MKADSASHLIRQPISFELFLFLYLICALLLQKINIYKTVSADVLWCALIRVIVPIIITGLPLCVLNY